MGPVWTFQPEPHADVLGSIGRDEPKASRHPRLDDDSAPTLAQLDHDPLAAAAQAKHRRSAYTALELLRRPTLEQKRVDHVEAGDGPTDQGRPEPPHHRLDLWQLGHRSILPNLDWNRR